MLALKKSNNVFRGKILCAEIIAEIHVDIIDMQSQSWRTILLSRQWDRRTHKEDKGGNTTSQFHAFIHQQLLVSDATPTGIPRAHHKSFAANRHNIIISARFPNENGNHLSYLLMQIYLINTDYSISRQIHPILRNATYSLDISIFNAPFTLNYDSKRRAVVYWYTRWKAILHKKSHGGIMFYMPH